MKMSLKHEDSEALMPPPYTNILYVFVQRMIQAENKEQLDDIKKELLENSKKEYLQKYFFLEHGDEYLKNIDTTEIFLRYGINISGTSIKKLAQIGAMLALHHHSLWKEWRADHSIDIPSLTQEWKKILSLEETLDVIKTYRNKEINFEDLLTLQETSSLTAIIKPQTLAEKLFSMHESFQSLFDPDIYDDDIWPIVQKIFEAKNKSEMIESFGAEEKYKISKLPIVGFLDELEKLHLLDTHNTLLQSSSPSDEDCQKAKSVVNQSRELFTKIVAAYAKITTSEAVDIRLEEMANNFSLEIDECKRSIEETKWFWQETKIISYVTVDMKEIIQNIRGCLGCLSKQSGNAKNLDFSRPNRFFITSYVGEDEQENISDQLLFLLPTDKGLCLVMDKLYGFHSLDVLLNHTLATIKKAEEVQTPINVFIPKTSVISWWTTMMSYVHALEAIIREQFSHANIETQMVKIDKTYVWYNESLGGDVSEWILISL